MNYFKIVFCNNNGYLDFHQKMNLLSSFTKIKHYLAEIDLLQRV